MRYFFLFGLGFFILQACGSSSRLASTVPSFSVNDYEDDRDQEKKLDAPDRLVIYTAYISIVVKDLEENQIQLNELIKQHDGYIESSRANSWTIRVPQTQFETLLVQIETLGTIKDKNLYSQDVTDQYRDTEIRLETLEKSRQRYLELLDKAEKVSEILEIERELERITVEIESLKGRLARLDSQLQYSTITVALQEKVKPGPIGHIGVGLYRVVKWLFVWN